MEAILDYITLYAPVIIAVISEIGVVAALIAKVTSYFKKADAAVKELKESAEYKQLRTQMQLVIEENYELKKKLDIVLEKITHVKVQDETVRDNQKI